MKNKGWHRRGYLPHWDGTNTIQGITFRLADSIPKHLLDSWTRELNHLPSEELRQTMTKLVARFEDQGYGECFLKDERCADILANSLRHFDGERYNLLEWCLMPNHVHLLIRQHEGHLLGDLIKGWKSVSSRGIQKLKGKRKAIWARDYFDRYIRDEDHYETAKAYIRQNPVKAGLSAKAEDYRWSSAYQDK